jgi:hypothetical protein
MALVCFQPVFWPPEGLWATGFTQYDQASVMAIAREYFDHGFAPVFGNPYSPDPETPRLFFQPWAFALGLAWRETAMDPGRLYLLSGLAGGIVMLRLAIALYLRLPPAARAPCPTLGLLVLCWGGGLFFFAGMVDSLRQGQLTATSAFAFDPAGGLWFLNLGRTLFSASEAFSHALALGLLLTLLDRRWFLSALLALLLVACQPFTGTQLLLVALGWVTVERLLAREPPPIVLAMALAATLGVALAYHLWYLPTHSLEYQNLEQHWRSPADSLRIESALLGWAPVVVLALVARLRGLVPLDRLQRLFWVMALGSLALANHQLFIAPNQPLQFTRGYVWTPFLLLGLPALQRLFAWLRVRWRLLPPALAAVFLLDNGAWLSAQLFANSQGAGEELYLRPNELAAMQRLQDPVLSDHLLVIDDHGFATLAMVYTPLRAWASHVDATPFAEARFAEVGAWQAAGGEVPAWQARPVVFLRRESGTPPASLAWMKDAILVERYGDLLLVTRPPLDDGPAYGYQGSAQ